jgi:hypothetical protein
MDWRLYTNATTAAVYEAALARYFGAAAGQARDEIMSLRHGPVPPARRMFEISAEETMGLRAVVPCARNRRSRGLKPERSGSPGVPSFLIE